MSQSTKIYIRNSKKYGKILNLSFPISTKELYFQAAATQNLTETSIRLYLNGKTIPNDDTQLTLKSQAIVHVVNLTQVIQPCLELNIRTLSGRTTTTKIEVESSETIRQFIDDKLYKVYGERSDKLILVHIGRQLRMDSTFAEEFIEDGSELFCVNTEQIKRKSVSRTVEIQQEQQFTLPVRDLEVAEEPKDIYPAPNFLIETPQAINATSNMQLLFDAKIHHSSSLPNYELPPQQTIPEESNLLSSESKDQEKVEVQTQIISEERVVTEYQVQEKFETVETAQINEFGSVSAEVTQQVETTETTEVIQVQTVQEDVTVQQVVPQANDLGPVGPVVIPQVPSDPYVDNLGPVVVPEVPEVINLGPVQMPEVVQIIPAQVIQVVPAEVVEVVAPIEVVQVVPVQVVQEVPVQVIQEVPVQVVGEVVTTEVATQVIVQPVEPILLTDPVGEVVIIDPIEPTEVVYTQEVVQEQAVNTEIVYPDTQIGVVVAEQPVIIQEETLQAVGIEQIYPETVQIHQTTGVIVIEEPAVVVLQNSEVETYQEVQVEAEAVNEGVEVYSGVVVETRDEVETYENQVQEELI